MVQRDQRRALVHVAVARDMAMPQRQLWLTLWQDLCYRIVGSLSERLRGPVGYPRESGILPFGASSLFSRQVISQDDVSLAPLGTDGAALTLDAVISGCERAGTSVFFFGSEAHIVYRVRDRVAGSFPRLTIAGICDGNFRGGTSPAIVDFIAGTNPGLIVLDLSEHQAQSFLKAHHHRFTGTPIVTLTGAFADFARDGERSRLSYLAGRISGWVQLTQVFRQCFSIARFSRIIIAQRTWGAGLRVRAGRSGAAIRRD